MSIPDNLTAGPAIFAPAPARCPGCERLRREVADRDAAVASLERRLREADARLRIERSHAEPREAR